MYFILHDFEILAKPFTVAQKTSPTQAVTMARYEAVKGLHFLNQLTEIMYGDSMLSMHHSIRYSPCRLKEHHKPSYHHIFIGRIVGTPYNNRGG